MCLRVNAVQRYKKEFRMKNNEARITSSGGEFVSFATPGGARNAKKQLPERKTSLKGRVWQTKHGDAGPEPSPGAGENLGQRDEKLFS